MTNSPLGGSFPASLSPAPATPAPAPAAAVPSAAAAEAPALIFPGSAGSIGTGGKPIPAVSKQITPFEFFPAWSPKPMYAVETLTYTLGAVFLGGATAQLVDVSNMAVDDAVAAALLKTFQGLTDSKGNKPLAGWQLSKSIGGTELAFQYFGSYAIYELQDQFGGYQGMLALYLQVAAKANSVNGGGMGNPGSWTLGKYNEPAWVPAAYTPPA